MGFDGPQGSGGGDGSGGSITDGDEIAIAYVPTNYAAGNGDIGTGGHLAGIDAALAAASGTPNLAAVLAMGYLPAAAGANPLGDATKYFDFFGKSMTVPAAEDFTFALGAGKVVKVGIGGVGVSLVPTADALGVWNYAKSAYGDLLVNDLLANGVVYAQNAGRTTYPVALFGEGADYIGVKLGAAAFLRWTAGEAYDASTLTLAQLAAASLRQGAAPSATPVAQTFTLGENGLGTNIPAVGSTWRTGLGTGIGSITGIGHLFQVPVLAASGTSQQTYQTALTMTSTGTTLADGAILGWNNAQSPGLRYNSNTNASAIYFQINNIDRFVMWSSRFGMAPECFITWSDTAGAPAATANLFAYQVSAGVFGLGTTSANGLGTLACAGITSVGNLTLALGAASAVKIGIGGVGARLEPGADYLYAKNYAGTDGANFYALNFFDSLQLVGLTPGGLRLSDGKAIIFSGVGALPGTPDLSLARLAAASLRQGLAPSASPVAQVFTLGEASRPATDTNVAGASGTFRSGLGTGNAASAGLLFQTPVVAVSGSAVQTYATQLTVATDLITTGAAVMFRPGYIRLISGSTYVQDNGFHTASGGWLGFGTTPDSEDISAYRVAANILGVGTAAASGAGSAWLAGTAGEKRLATAPTDSTATLTDLTALTETLIAGRIYTGTMQIVVNNALAADGLQIDFSGGTVTMTSVQFGFSSALGATLGTRTSTALATPITLSALADTSDVVIDVFFTCVVNAGGTLIPRFAKAANFAGATLTVRVGGYLHLKDTIG